MEEEGSIRLLGMKMRTKRKKPDKAGTQVEEGTEAKPKKRPRTNTKAKKRDTKRCIKIIKTGFRSLLTWPTEEQPSGPPKMEQKWLWRTVRFLSHSQAQFCHRASILAKAFVLRRLTHDKEVPDMNKRFYMHCIKAVCSNTSKHFTTLCEEEYDRDLLAAYENIKGAFEGEDAPVYETYMGEHLEHAANGMATNLKNNAANNFESWLLRYCRFLIAKRGSTEDWKTNEQIEGSLQSVEWQTLAWAKRMRNKVLWPKSYDKAKDSYLNGKDKKPRKNAASFKQKQEDKKKSWLPLVLEQEASELAKVYESHKSDKTGSVTSGMIKKSLGFFIKKGFEMLKELEAHEGRTNHKGETIKWKLWRIVPEHKATRVNIRIDTTSLFAITKRFEPGLLKTFGLPSKNPSVEDKQKLWHMLNLRGNPRPAKRRAIRSSTKYLFDYSIVTDGISCSVQFTVPKPPNQDLDEETDKRKKKPDWKPAFTEVFEGLKEGANPCVFGMDPGRCNMLTVQGWPLNQNDPFDQQQGQKPVKAIFTARHYHNAVKSQAKSERSQRYLRTEGFRPPTDMSVSLDVLKARAAALCQKRSECPERYKNELVSRQKWDTYIRRPKAINRFVDGLVRSANPRRDPDLKPVFLLGNASFDHTMHTTNRDPPGCNLAVKKIFASRNDLVLLEVSEHMTTKLCARCGKESVKSYKKVEYKTEDDKTKARTVANRDARHCQKCATGSDEMLHRDYNAAVNIRNKYQETTIRFRHP